MVGTSSLEDGLVDTTTTGNNADHGAVSRGDDLLGSRGQLDTGPLGVHVVGDDGGVVAGASSQTAAITGLLLQVGDDGTFGHHACNQKSEKKSVKISTILSYIII